MVRWYFKNPYGYYTRTVKDMVTGEVRKFKNHILRGNCLWVEVYFYTNEEGQKMQQYISFFNDIRHLKNWAKDKDSVSPLYYDADNFVFYQEELGPEQWKAIKEIAKLGKKITIKTKKKNKK